MYRELQQFIVLVEQASVTKAAAVLGITQSALSKSLQRLEDHLGLQLAERGARGLALTEEGRSVYDHARRVDAEMRSLELDARVLGEGRRRRVRIGASPSWSMACIPNLVARIGQSEADLELSVHVELETELLRLLAQGELDIALSNTDLGPTDHHVARDAFLAVDVRIAGCVASASSASDVDVLLARDWIDYRNALDQPAWEGGSIRSKVKGRIVQTSSWLDALLIAARVDALIPLPAHLAPFLPQFGLQFIDGIEPITRFNAGLCYRTSFAMTRTGRMICDSAKVLMRAAVG
jgi:DNA-binding transcriptional LysR family regulator